MPARGVASARRARILAHARRGIPACRDLEHVSVAPSVSKRHEENANARASGLKPQPRAPTMSIIDSSMACARSALTWVAIALAPALSACGREWPRPTGEAQGALGLATFTSCTPDTSTDPRTNCGGPTFPVDLALGGRIASGVRLDPSVPSELRPVGVWPVGALYFEEEATGFLKAQRVGTTTLVANAEDNMTIDYLDVHIHDPTHVGFGRRTAAGLEVATTHVTIHAETRVGFYGVVFAGDRLLGGELEYTFSRVSGSMTLEQRGPDLVMVEMAPGVGRIRISTGDLVAELDIFANLEGDAESASDSGETEGAP